MNVLELFKALKIDFTETIISYNGGTELRYDFDISPKTFLNFSKKDFRQGDKRGLLNALTNAKRAIDCQTEKVLQCIGLTKPPYPDALKLYVTRSGNRFTRKDLPYQLQIIQAIRFAPGNVTANVRTLRHKLEHFYQLPTHQEVEQAIELAELYILATDNKLKLFWDYSVSDSQKMMEKKLKQLIKIDVSYDSTNKYYELRPYSKDKLEPLIIRPDQIEFYYLLRIATQLDHEEDVLESLEEFLDTVGHPIPKENISVFISD